MRKTHALIALAVVMCAASWARCAPDSTRAVAPLVNENTFAVVRADIDKIDFPALGKYLDQLVQQSGIADSQKKAASRDLHASIDEAQKFADQFTHAGGHALWIVFTLEDFPRSDPVILVVPLDNPQHADAIKKVLLDQAPGDSSADLIDGRIVVSSHAWARALKPQSRPELAAALGQNDAPVQAALIPSEYARRIVETMAPPLPGGVSSTALSRGVLWASLALQPPPQEQFRLVVQSQDNASAQQLMILLQACAAQARHAQADLPETAALRAAAALADHANVQQDRLTIELGKEQLTALATEIAKSLQGARDEAAMAVSANNMRQLLMLCTMYANDHKGVYPASLEEAIKNRDVVPSILNNPRPGAKGGYIYLRPSALPMQDASQRLLIYEDFDDFDGGVNAGFADGHVEWVGDRKVFDTYLQQAKHPAQAGNSVPPQSDVK